MSREQLELSFVQEMEDKAKRRNQEAILRSHLERYPRNEYVDKVLPPGIRLKHHVGDWECEKCPYAATDHGLGWRFGFYQDRWGSQVGICVCIKDMIKKGHITKDEVTRK